MAVKTAYFAGGCFWGLEELFRAEPGVVDTEVGYTGGENDSPTYEYHPGHAETLKIIYEDSKTSYKKLLDFFFRVHDPTTKNQQGNDIGSSYRSAIFYTSEEEKRIAEEVICLTNKAKLYSGEAVTSLELFKGFYTAEDYHQDYLKKNPGGYTCHFVRSEMPLTQ